MLHWKAGLLLGAEHLVIQFLHDLSELRLQVLDRLELNSAAHGDFYVCAVSIDVRRRECRSDFMLSEIFPLAIRLAIR
jgi:hypothetical protein